MKVTYDNDLNESVQVIFSGVFVFKTDAYVTGRLQRHFLNISNCQNN